MYKPIITIALSIMFVACNTGYKTINNASGKYKLVWNDEFNKAGMPDETKWSYDTIGNSWSWGNNEKQFYTVRKPENVFVKNGVLTIVALKDSVEDKPFTSARLVSKGKGDWLYGRFEIRAKLPTGRGTWPAIWMLPTEKTYGGWPASGEIDIMEQVGNDPFTIHATAHTKKYNHIINTQKTNKMTVPTATTEFHNYILEWEKDEYRIFVDDTLLFTFKNEGSGFEAWPFDQQFHMILNLAIGGNWGGNKGIDMSIFPVQMEVDYVRVYEKVR